MTGTSPNTPQTNQKACTQIKSSCSAGWSNVQRWQYSTRPSVRNSSASLNFLSDMCTTAYTHNTHDWLSYSRRSVEQQALWDRTQGWFVSVRERSYCTEESWDLSLSSFRQLSLFTQNKWVSDPAPVLTARRPAGQDFKCQTEAWSKKSPPFEERTKV